MEFLIQDEEQEPEPETVAAAVDPEHSATLMEGEVSSPSKKQRTEGPVCEAAQPAPEALGPLEPPPPQPAPEEPTSFRLFSNDDTDEACRALITLKNIFSKQLPKMPKEYIVRLVLDRRHVTLALMKGPRIIGGVCYRPYFEQHFAEIAFLAISANEQVRGFGTMLMNELKHHVQPQGIEYFLTFADNFAIGYFQKQGFTKTIGMPKERWVGYIKEYDGGTLMECYLHPAVNYRKVGEMVAFQRRFILARVKERSQSHVTYGGITIPESARKKGLIPLDVPGFCEAGWGAQFQSARGSERDRNILHSRLANQLKSLLERLRALECSWPFMLPVNSKEAPDYYEKILNPIDLSIIAAKLKESDFYRTKDMMKADLMRMVENCMSYNEQGTEYYEAAQQMMKSIVDAFDDGEMAGANDSGVQ